MDMGLIVDPVASTTSASIMIGSVWGYMNMVNFRKSPQRRDNEAAEAQLLRNAKLLVLEGKMDLDTYERAVADAESARARASAYSLPGQTGEQDDSEQLLQDFQYHLREKRIPAAVPLPRQPRQPRVRSLST
jgi:hypothetical protein